MSEEVKYTAYGETKTLKEWADDIGVSTSALRRRVRRRGSVEDAIDLSINRSKRRMNGGGYR